MSALHTVRLCFEAVGYLAFGCTVFVSGMCWFANRCAPSARTFDAADRVGGRVVEERE